MARFGPLPVTTLRQPPLENPKCARPALPRQRLRVVCGLWLGMVVAAQGADDARLKRRAELLGPNATAAVPPLWLLLQTADSNDPIAQQHRWRFH
jgi:hypothetical protein